MTTERNTEHSATDHKAPRSTEQTVAGQDRTSEHGSTMDHRAGSEDVTSKDGYGASESANAHSSTFDLFREDERHELRERWDHLQTRFVDDPEGSTREADDLLDDTLDRIASRWQERHGRLRKRWSRDDVSTEELRSALKEYRDAFERLLAS